MPVKPLPPNPSLDHLKYQAKDLLKLHSTGALDAAQRIREFHPRFKQASDAEIFASRLRLADAQLAIAREHGFASWARLKRRVEKPRAADSLDRPYQERIADGTFRRALELLDGGDAEGLRRFLEENPKLVRQHIAFEGGNYFRNPTLLEFIAENPVRHGTLPANIVEVATVILDARAELSSLNEALGLVVTGRVPRECGVQIPLIELLCSRGADPNYAARPSAAHGEFQALDALIRLGARIDLPLAAALGREEEFSRLLPAAPREDRHLALALAAQFGHVNLVRRLLVAGEDPNRYNPPGAHSHSMPLHQAALGGHESVVRLLVERGARVGAKDIMWSATAAGWAQHGGHKEIEEYLRGKEREDGVKRKA